MVLLEDFAALLGLIFALFGVGLTLLTDNGYWDVAGTVAIGLLLVTVAIVLAVETKSLLLGEAAAPRERELIAARIRANDHVLDILSLRTLHLGPEQVLVACKISVRPTDSAQLVTDTINAVEDSIRQAVPSATHIFIEPDIFRAAVASSG